MNQRERSDTQAGALCSHWGQLCHIPFEGGRAEEESLGYPWTGRAEQAGTFPSTNLDSACAVCRRLDCGMCGEARLHQTKCLLSWGFRSSVGEVTNNNN